MSKRAIVYVEDSHAMHREWDERFKRDLELAGISTLHCIGFKPPQFPVDMMQLMTVDDVMQSSSSIDLLMVVTDVWMPDQTGLSQKGGLAVVEDIATRLQDAGKDMPPVLIASKFPEKLAELRTRGIRVIGDVKINGDNVKDDAHWKRIWAYLARHLQIGQLQIDLLCTEPRQVGKYKLYGEVAIRLRGEEEPFRQLRVWSIPSMVLQILVLEAPRSVSHRALHDFLIENWDQLRSLAGETGPFSKQRADSTIIADAVRQACHQLRTDLPNIIVSLKDARNMFVAGPRWVDKLTEVEVQA